MKKDISPENYADVMWELIMSDNPAVIARLEAKLDGTQSEAVDEYIENSCWSQDLPQFVGNKGTALKRREALRAAYVTQQRHEPDSDPPARWASEELAAVIKDGPPYDPEEVMDWFNKKAELLLMEIEALEVLCPISRFAGDRRRETVN